MSTGRAHVIGHSCLSVVPAIAILLIFVRFLFFIVAWIGVSSSTVVDYVVAILKCGLSA